MKAFIINKPNFQPILTDIPKPIPRHDEVLVNVAYCGVNRADLKLIHGDYGTNVPYPITMGSEVTGTLEDGTPIAVNPYISCGDCSSCKHEDFMGCANGWKLLGVHKNGGYAEYVSVPRRNIIPLPKDVSLEQAAALTLSAGTAYRMVHTMAQIKPSDKVIITAAASGVGIYAVQFAKLIGSDVYAVVSNEEKKKFVEQFDVHAIIDPDYTTWSEHINNADVIIDTLGKTTFEYHLSSLTPGGRITFCGVTTGALANINLATIYYKQLKILGSSGVNNEDVKNIFKLAAEKKLLAQIEEIYSFKHFHRALEKLRLRSVSGKLLLRIL